MGIVDFSNSKIKRFIIHGIGNKCKEENIIISNHEIPIEDEVTKQYLLQYFISSFKFNAFYSFRHESDIQLNEIYTYAKNIFCDNNTFVLQSGNIAKHLYEVSTHPNIKRGELYIAYLTGCILDGKDVELIGIFKSENKDIYLNVNSTNDGYSINLQSGVNVEKLDKGCVIFNADVDNGYYVDVVDSNNVDSKYWKENFLKVDMKNNEYSNTKGLLKVCKSFVKEINDIQPTEKVAFLNNSLTYFQNHDTFDLDEFSADIVNEPILHDKFKEYIVEKYSDLEQETPKNFAISSKAVTEIKRNIKNYIKLDSNVEIRINPNVKNIGQIVEKGYDSMKNMNYYKIYYNDEK